VIGDNSGLPHKRDRSPRAVGRCRPQRGAKVSRRRSPRGVTAVRKSGSRRVPGKGFPHAGHTLRARRGRSQREHRSDTCEALHGYLLRRITTSADIPNISVPGAGTADTSANPSISGVPGASSAFEIRTIVT